MLRRYVTLAILLAGLATLATSAGVLLAQTSAGANSGKSPDKTAKGVFGLTKIHEFHIEISAAEWAKMQPPPSKGFFGGLFGLGAPATPKPPAEKDVPKPVEKSTDIHKGGSFGIEFPWVHATLMAEGKTYTDVGLRYKGGGSYVTSGNQLKRNFKIDIDRYHAEQAFHGLKMVTLNSGAADPTRYREALAYPLYRAAGVPAPRTAFAQVTVSVPGKYDKELAGLYTLVENVDKSFLKHHFKNGGGLLLKPEIKLGAQRKPFAYLGEDWEKYKEVAGPKREPTKAEARRVIDFAKLINQPSDDTFHRDIGSYLDVDEFLRFLAVTALVCNLDSIFTVGHNALIYLVPETNKFAFIPWDLDLSFGGFFAFGQPDQLATLSLMHPYAGDFKLVDRLLTSKDVAEKYQKILRELSTTCFTKEKLLADLDAAEKATKEIIAKETSASQARMEKAGGFGFGPMPGGTAGSASLRTFVEKRTAAVAAQLAGESKGTIPTSGFGFGGFFGQPKKDGNP